jgi:hypothetical protein
VAVSHELELSTAVDVGTYHWQQLEQVLHL